MIFPPKCTFCHKLLSADDKKSKICSECRNNLILYPEPYYAEGLVENTDVCYAPLEYTGMVRESLHRYKFSGCSFYADVYAEIICSALGKELSSCDIITWVPLSKRRLRERGYDQAELIAAAVSRRIGIKCVRMLDKIRNIKPQSGIGEYKLRKNNIKDAYKLSKDGELLRLNDPAVLIVDDIVTTGATIGECSRVLKCAGFSHVIACCAAGRAR